MKSKYDEDQAYYFLRAISLQLIPKHFYPVQYGMTKRHLVEFKEEYFKIRDFLDSVGTDEKILDEDRNFRKIIQNLAGTLSHLFLLYLKSTDINLRIIAFETLHRLTPISFGRSEEDLDTIVGLYTEMSLLKPYFTTVENSEIQDVYFEEIVDLVRKRCEPFTNIFLVEAFGRFEYISLSITYSKGI